MSDEPKKRRSLAPIVWMLGLLLLLYVLSAGPVGWLVNHGYLDYRRANAAYSPFGWMYERSRAMHRVVDWYLHLWDGSP
jgi:hypothetical protein